MEANRFLRFANESYIRRVLLENDFKVADAEIVAMKLMELNAHDSSPIVLEINSNGGDFQSAHELSRLIHTLRAPVYGLVIGNCYSSAFHILQACTLRLALPMASFLFHNNFKSVVIRTTADMDLDVVMGMLAQEKSDRVRSRRIIIRTTQERNPTYTEGQLLQIMRDEKLMSADSALAKGFIDEILRI